MNQTKSTDPRSHSESGLPPLQSTPRFWVIGFVLAAFILLLFIRHYQYLLDRHAVAPVRVVAAIARSNDVPVYLAALGSVTPTYNVTVKTQINGQLLKVFYREGQLVKTGELLAQIDPRPYEAQLIQYEGQYARDRALLTNAELDLKRYQTLWKQDSVSKQTLDTQEALVKQDQGTVKLDQGLLENTKLNLTYCQIISPIDGRVGLRLVDPGNYVQVSDANGLVVINTLNPITVIFTIPEDNVPQVMQQVNAGNILKVLAFDREQTKLLAAGTLLTVDNQIDPTTGTVKLKAQFKNDESKLFPDQFVNVKLLVNTLHNAIIIPTAAVQYGPQGPYVYLLKQDHTVSVKPVVVGVTINGNTSITTGISPQQSVIVEGTDKLTEGAKVIVSNKKSLAPPAKMKSNTHRRVAA